MVSGTVYPMLAPLEAEGWATSNWESDAPDVRGPRKRLCELTPTGLEEARAAASHRRADPAASAAPGTRPGNSPGLAGK